MGAATAGWAAACPCAPAALAAGAGSGALGSAGAAALDATPRDGAGAAGCELLLPASVRGAWLAGAGGTWGAAIETGAALGAAAGAALAVGAGLVAPGLTTMCSVCGVPGSTFCGRRGTVYLLCQARGPVSGNRVMQWANSPSAQHSPQHPTCCRRLDSCASSWRNTRPA